ncbi:response regulator transcription factor, partial [Dactylosporangium sp. NPDC005572]|uniref:response regulator n=1 Tax=Dactylosporangium sp. NPDC005572 TaxID=3156889 RepID=UPI0033BD04E4
MIRVLLVDDHPIVLAGLSALVESDSALRLVGAARTAADALAADTEPDIAVLDLRLPDGDGIALGAALKQRWPGVRVVVFTMHADDRSVIRSLGAGLDGYLLKDSDPDDVLAAIHSAAHGTLVLGRGAQAAVVAAA